MNKVLVSSLLVFAFASAFALAQETDAKKLRWECKARSEAGRVFTSRSTNRIWAKAAALDKCERAAVGPCLSGGCHKKRPDRD